MSCITRAMSDCGTDATPSSITLAYYVPFLTVVQTPVQSVMSCITRARLTVGQTLLPVPVRLQATDAERLPRAGESEQGPENSGRLSRVCRGRSAEIPNLFSPVLPQTLHLQQNALGRRARGRCSVLRHCVY